jgi:replicative DNA helicase
MQSLQKNSSQIQESKLFIDDAPKGITLKQLRPKLKRLINKHDIKVLIVDYLQLIKPEGKKENRTTDVSEIAEGLKGIAKEFNIVVVALAQLSRAVEQRDNKRPQLSDLRESGSIEAAADAVMFIYRAEYYLERLRPDEKFEPAEFSKWLQKMQEVKGKAEIIIAKNRNGVGAGTIQYSFDGEFSKFSELE